jgi:hypothetical protein
MSVRWRNEAAMTVVLAAKGYPGAPLKGTPIAGLEQVVILDPVIARRDPFSRSDGELPKLPDIDQPRVDRGVVQAQLLRADLRRSPGRPDGLPSAIRIRSPKYRRITASFSAGTRLRTSLPFGAERSALLVQVVG